jgi:hypothetical protein
MFSLSTGSKKFDAEGSDSPMIDELAKRALSPPSSLRAQRKTLSF